ncbi:hypothetical protein NMY22_g16307 [Coprinellus aureogranulatus]|nr:hypothetical protein NMY22_g16307 [Coprinellus aureogranulatus]
MFSISELPRDVSNRQACSNPSSRVRESVIAPSEESRALKTSHNSVAPMRTLPLEPLGRISLLHRHNRLPGEPLRNVRGFGDVGNVGTPPFPVLASIEYILPKYSNSYDDREQYLYLQRLTEILAQRPTKHGTDRILLKGCNMDRIHVEELMNLAPDVEIANT